LGRFVGEYREACGDIFEHGIVQHCLCQQLLELGILVFKRLESLRVRYLQTAKLAVLFVEGCVAGVFATDLSRLRSGLLLPQDADNLLFREPVPLHVQTAGAHIIDTFSRFSPALEPRFSFRGVCGLTSGVSPSISPDQGSPRTMPSLKGLP
jgi:hypothetical protein